MSLSQLSSITKTLLMILLRLFLVSIIVMITGKAPFSVGLPLIVNFTSFSFTALLSNANPGGSPETLTDKSGCSQFELTGISRGSISSSKQSTVSAGGFPGMMMAHAAFSDTHPSLSTGVFAGVSGHLSKRLFTPSLSSSF